MSNDDLVPQFFRIATELSVDSFNSIKMSGVNSGNPYQAIDSFSRLIAQLIRKYPAPESGSILPGANELAVKIFSVIVLVLVQSQDVNPNDFDQKPFLRIFSSVLNDLKPMELENPLAYQQIICSLGYVFIFSFLTI